MWTVTASCMAAEPSGSMAARMTSAVEPHLRQRPTVGLSLGRTGPRRRGGGHAGRLKGGISTNTRAVTIERPDGTRRRAVLRTFTDDGWIQAEPDLAAREAALLEVLERAGVPAPRLLGVDADGSASGSISMIMTLEPADPSTIRPIGGPGSPASSTPCAGSTTSPHPPSRTCATRPPASTCTRRRRHRCATGWPSSRSCGPPSPASGRRLRAARRRCSTTTTTPATCCGPVGASRASSTGPARGSATRSPTSATCARTCRWCPGSPPATRCWPPTRR